MVVLQIGEGRCHTFNPDAQEFKPLSDEETKAFEAKMRELLEKAQAADMQAAKTDADLTTSPGLETASQSLLQFPPGLEQPVAEPQKIDAPPGLEPTLAMPPGLEEEALAQVALAQQHNAILWAQWWSATQAWYEWAALASLTLQVEADGEKVDAASDVSTESRDDAGSRDDESENATESTGDSE